MKNMLKLRAFIFFLIIYTCKSNLLLFIPRIFLKHQEESVLRDLSFEIIASLQLNRAYFLMIIEALRAIFFA